LALSLILAILKAVFSHGAFGALNKAAGFLFGAAFSTLLAWGVAVVFEYVIHLPTFASAEWAMNFDGGFVYDFFNTYNPIELLLSF
jgi:hypothetical protein